MGGKIRQSKAIAKTLVDLYKGETTYYEPFMGALGSAEKVVPALYHLGVRRFVLSDNSLALVNFWRSVVYHGWTPPSTVNQETYDYYKNNRDLNDPMTAYCGYAMSFGGKWFGGLARDYDTHRMQANQKRATLRKAEVIKAYGVEITCCDYKTLHVNKSIIYCDPPYSNRTKAHHNTGFRADEFWEWATNLSTSNTVVVSEFSAPEDWYPIYSWGNTVVTHHLGNKNTQTDERLWLHRGFITQQH
jgi:DNA adenine methylase